MPNVFGLDLAQASDYSAIAGLEQSATPEGRSAYAVRYLRRWPIGTSYVDIVGDVAKLLARPERRGPLIVDGTGVGRPVLDVFRQRGVPGIVPVTITAGHEATRSDDGGWHVPKKELVAAVQVLLQSRRLVIASGLAEAATLSAELMNFRVKITAAANETFGTWREGDHDDLLLSVAMACWYGERHTLGPYKIGSRQRPTIFQRMPHERFATKRW